MTLDLFFDPLLCLAIVAVAVRALATADLFEAVVLFMVFGLLLSFAWARLQAVDVAIAEAAIGAGLTGALFLNALGRSGDLPAEARRQRRWTALLPVLGLAAVLALALGRTLLAPVGAPGLREAVMAELPASGVSNPVTAVLLNFRAYDTLLEVAVLTLAVAAVWSVRPEHSADPARTLAPGPILIALVRIIAPIAIVVGAYLLWAGSSAPGGAFQAGAVIGAAGILLQVAGFIGPPDRRRGAVRMAVVGGLAGFLGVAVGVMGGSRQFLEYRAESASGLILLVETLLTISIAVMLFALFAGAGRPPAGARGTTPS